MTSRLVVLADTHMPRRGRHLPAEVLKAIAEADLVVHLGDFTAPEVADELSSMGRLLAVHGNNDSPELKSRFPDRQDICIEGHRLVLIHGDVGGRTALAAARGLQEGDIVLFGHSHRPFLAEEAGRILLNPGSPTDRRWGPYCSFATVEVGETIEARIVRLP